MAIRELRFGVRAVDTNGATAGGAINSGVAGAPNEIQPGWLGTDPRLEFQQLLAFADLGADGAATDWGGGVLADTAFNLADMKKDGQVGTLAADDTAADPVLLTAHGQVNKSKAGDLTDAVRFSDALGFGLGNGVDAKNALAWLNNGDAIDVAATGGEPLRSVAFTVQVRDPGAAVTLALDVDGSTLTVTGNGKNAAIATHDLLELAGLRQGDQVRIDAIEREITVNGVAQAAPATFWTAFAAAGADNLTLGSRHDGAAAFALKDLRVTVGTPDDQPVTATDDAYAATEDTPLMVAAAEGVLANDGASDGGLAAEPGTISTVQGGTVQLAADGSFTYTPAGDFNGADSFAYTARDADGDTAAASINITVAAVNDAPIARDETAIASEDGTLAIRPLLLVTDVDTSDILTVPSAEIIEGSGSVSIGEYSGFDNVLFYTPGEFYQSLAEDASDTAKVTYTVRDSQGAEDTGLFTFTIKGENDTPIIVAQSFDAEPSGPAGTVLGAVEATDVDAGDSPTFAIIDGNTDGRFAIAAATGVLTTTRPLDFESDPISSALTVRVTDAGGLSASATVTVTLTDLPENHAPTDLALSNATVREDDAGAVIGTLSVVDPDTGDLHGFAVDDRRFEVVGDTLKLKAGVSLDLEADREVTLAITATDSGGLSYTESFTITVSGASNSPIAPVLLTDVAAGVGGFKISDAGSTNLGAHGLTTIRDLNGDGRDEILVSASQPTAAHQGGAAYVVFGRAGGAPVDLAAVAAGADGGFVILGENFADNLSHTALTSIADLNGDGRDEILVAAKDNGAGGTGAGAAYVVFGKADAAPVDLDRIAAGEGGGFKIIAENANDQLGFWHALATIGDLNGDGRREILVGSRDNGAAVEHADAGAVYVVFGKEDGAPVDLDGIAAGDGGGYKISAESFGDQLGIAQNLTTIADLNGDGRDEILVGGRGNRTGDSGGAAYVVFGKADAGQVDLGAVAAGNGGFKISGENASDQLSDFSLATIDDLNGDGRDEILVGSLRNDAGGDDAGAVYVVFGKADGGLVDLDGIAAGAGGGFKIIGEAAGDLLGQFTLTSIADLNGDGRDEILAGAHGNGGFSGAAYVVFGKADAGPVDLEGIAAGNGGGFKMLAEEAGDHLSEISLTSITDLNGDGRSEILVGAKDNGAGAGAAYVVFGKQDDDPVDLDEIASGRGGFKIVGENPGDQLSFAGLTTISDLNGDGREEILVAAQRNDGAGLDAGAAYVVYSSPDWLVG